jgi:PEP-CTERM motif
MRKSVSFAVAALGALALSTPAQAVTFVVTNGSAAVFNASKVIGAGEKVVTFDAGTPAPTGVVMTGGALMTGTSGLGAQPFGSDGSRYLSVTNGKQAEVRDTIAPGYGALSFYLGSIDSYNTISILDTAGSVIASFGGSLFASPANGDRGSAQTNRLLTFTQSAGGPAFGGLRVRSGGNSAEIENVRFSSPVPEPASWAMMLAGFAVVGFVMRRRQVRVSFA